MTLVSTQSNFRAHIKGYLDLVNDADEMIYVARANNRTVAVMSQEKLDWIERALRAKEDSLEYAISHDRLIKRRVLPDDEITESNDEYWRQFEKQNIS